MNGGSTTNPLPHRTKSRIGCSVEVSGHPQQKPVFY